MSLVRVLNDACAVLHEGGDPATLASHWGEPDGATARLILIAPSDSRFNRVRLLVDEAGRVDEVVFELPAGAEIPVSQLADAYGEPDEERAMDGPTVLWFAPPDGRGCRILAFLQRGASAERSTRQVSVVAPRRPAMR